MRTLVCFLLAVVPVASDDARPASAADVVTLKDRTVVLGQVENPSDRGKLVMIVGRAWARGALPAKLEAWEKFEEPHRKRARRERLERLGEWERERRDGLAGGGEEAGRDPLLRSLARAIERLQAPEADGSDPALIMVPLDRREVARVERRSRREGRWLRLGWRAGFADVETMPVADLKTALEGRNFALDGDDFVSLEDLLPLPIESEERWRLRRAATEVKADRGAWFVRHGDMVLPERGSGQSLDLVALGGIGNLSSLLRELTGEAPPEDPLPKALRTVAARGGVGAVVTQLTIAADLSGVEVASTLWVRVGDDPSSWKAAGSRTAEVRTEQLRRDAGANIAADPQVKAVFDLAEGLGLGQVTPEMKERALGIGAATQAALGQVRAAAQSDLDALAIPLDGE